MGEIKSVKVDNWGVFFLQKLQNFFNKTDYCDLTLQFRDNSQLKVHRLVLSACTDYFNVLEQKCEVVDDAIIMPSGLQADVVVPIVNFMYTGTLEFELKMYSRLLKTAKDMNMTVLLKLLEAHRRTMEMNPQKNQMPTSPKMRRKPVPLNTAGAGVSTAGRSLIQPQHQRRVIVGDNTSQQPQQQRNVQPNTYTRVTSSSMAATSLPPVKQQIGSTTFTRIKQEPEQDENVGGGGYTLLKKSVQQPHHVTSPFEQLRKGYNNNKRPAAATFISPPAKKPNLEDVKEFAEQQRMRKQIAAEFGDDGDYDAGIMDDDTIHNDDDDDEMAGASATPSSASAAVQTSTTQQQSEDPPGTTTIIVKHEGPDKPPTIVVKDSSNSKMNHAKIISEVLRQYPHLVNSNKNIKLKIMPNAGGQTQKIVVKKEPADHDKLPTVAAAASTVGPRLSVLPKLEDGKVLPAVSSVVANKPKPQSIQSANITTNKIVVGSTTSQPAVATSTPLAAPPQKRRIDSKTMHSLIAMGAENTTGPWLCLRCGRNGHPISIPSYRGFRRHLINTHKETIDPSLCEHCGWRSASKRELHFHMQLEHKVKTNLYIFPECQLCQEMCIDSDALNQHLIDSHPDENKQQCIYCNKIFPEELQLYTHMKTFHKKQALEDGIIDYSDDENTNTELAFPPPLEEHEMDVNNAPQQQQQKKIKILSDISLPIASSIIKTDTILSTTEHVLTTGESTTSAASEDYLQEQQEHVETKFVAADGSEVILTDEQRKEILSQLNQENDGSGVVMVLNENQHYAGGETQLEQGVISHDETSQATTATNDEHEEHGEHDDSQIYNELKSQRQHATEDEDITSQAEPETTRDHDQEVEHAEEQGKEEIVHHDAALDESKESTDNLEWAENLISEHDMADDTPETSAEVGVEPKQVNKEEEPKDDESNKSQDDINKKLKELAGDWSEDDDEDEEMLDETTTTQKLEENDEMPKKENVPVGEEEELVDHEMAEPEKVLETIEHSETADTKETSETADTKAEELVSKSVEQIQKEEKESKAPIEEEAEAMVEDDVDLALKSMHKDNDDEEDNSKEGEEQEEKKTAETDKSLAGSTDVKENVEVVQETTITEMNIEDKDCEKTAESLQEEVNVSPDECETAKLAKEEETKKDLIDMLLSEQAESETETGDTRPETDDNSKEETVNDSTSKIVTELTTDIGVDVEETTKSEIDEADNENALTAATESSAQEPLIKEEFLDMTPEKVLEKKEKLRAAAVSSAGPEAPTSPRASPKDTATSEERVKSLISEWGDDDDEDENDNEDADLKANL